MQTLAINLILAAAIAIVVADGLLRIVEQFGKHTPYLIAGGVVLVTVGAAGWFLSPVTCGAMLIGGRALQVIGGMRRMRG